MALHIVELFRFPSVGFAASAELYDESRQAVCENGKGQLQEFVRTTLTMKFSLHSWCTRE